MIWHWDIDMKSENSPNISGIQALDDAEDVHQMDNCIVVNQKAGSHFEEFNRIDFEVAK